MIELSRTQAICNQCFATIEAQVVEEGEAVYLLKQCPAHGSFKELIASDASWYIKIIRDQPNLRTPAQIKNPPQKGCPHDCGYCFHHQMKLHLPVVPVTSACNLDCPVCYTLNNNIDPFHMTMQEFSAILHQIQAGDPEMQIINFTGGEPLVHPQFLSMVKMCHQRGIQRITISTNGLALLADEGLLEQLTRYGARIVLSFNSFDSLPYRVTAGSDLLQKKLDLLEMLSRYKPTTTLLSVVAAGVNEGEIGEIVKYVLDSDYIVSSEIHTVTFTGQNVSRFDRRTRITTPAVIKNICSTNDFLERDDFLPSPCAHPLCYSNVYLLRLSSGQYVPFTRFVPRTELLEMLSHSIYMEPSPLTEGILNNVINEIWSRSDVSQDDEAVLSALRRLMKKMFPLKSADMRERRREAENAVKAIYIHSHMDLYNFDLKRIAQCSVGVPDGGGGVVPTCAYNLFYRARDSRFNPGTQ